MWRALFTLLGLTLAAGVTHAAPPAVYELPWTPRDFSLATARTDVLVRYFTVEAPETLVAKRVNNAVYAATDIARSKAGWRRHDHRRLDVEGLCLPGVLTNVVVSFRCGVAEIADDPLEEGDGGAPSGNYVWVPHNYVLEGGRLVPITLRELFGGRADVLDVLSRAAGRRVTEHHVRHLLVEKEGLVYYDEGSGIDERDTFLSGRFVIPLAGFAAELRPDHPWTRIAGAVEDVDTTPRRVKATPGEARFVSAGDVVSDQVTGLTWSAADNGNDVTHAEAAAYCAELTLGGRRGWRLPTLVELDLISDVGDRNKPTDPTRDCVRGKYAYAAPRAFQLSCGMAWSADVDGRSAGALGFVSGKRLTKRLTASKNLRALCVTGP